MLQGVYVIFDRMNIADLHINVFFLTEYHLIFLKSIHPFIEKKYKFYATAFTSANYRTICIIQHVHSARSYDTFVQIYT